MNPGANPAAAIQASVVADGMSNADIRILVANRLLQIRNLLDQQVRDAPLRTLAVIGLLLAIWYALFELLNVVLGQVRNWGLVGVVANQHLYVHFFVVLAVMLAFSNAVLTFGSLYGKHEPAFLMSLPASSRSVIVIKWVEGVILSSWSFLLLGVPLMLAIAHNADVKWYFYPLFLFHFLSFVLIPSSLGLLAALAVAMWAPRRPVSIAIGLGMVLLLLVIYWFSNISYSATEADQWLQTVFRQVALLRQPLLPSTWTAMGVIAAIEGRVEESLTWLLVVIGNGGFLSWVTINALAHTWPEAYSRSQEGRLYSHIRRGWITSTANWALFFYLPEKLRHIMLKDMRTFARDAKQWSQMAIMLGLLVIYVLNLQRLPVDIDSAYTKGLISFLNLTTVSLILATFTSRFVYPLLSLESQQLWLIELIPVQRWVLLLVKFLFALMITGLSSGLVMYLAITVLRLPPLWARVNLLVCLGVCIGLSGLSIGLGARFPVLTQRNPARIAAGFGGTVNLILSMVFVGLEMAGVLYICVRSVTTIGAGSLTVPTELTPEMFRVVILLVALGVAVAASALLTGMRHFSRLEV